MYVFSNCSYLTCKLLLTHVNCTNDPTLLLTFKNYYCYRWNSLMVCAKHTHLVENKVLQIVGVQIISFKTKLC